MKTLVLTEEQKQELRDKGYVVEDMQAVWGDGWWNGLYRFQNKKTGDFGEPQNSEDAVWVDALQYEEELRLHNLKQTKG